MKPALLAVTFALLAACSKPLVKASSAVQPPAAPKTQLAADSEPDLRDRMMRAVPELATVQFAYDSDRLDESALAVLKANAAYLKTHADAEFQAAGHCDQRGTVEYNLALGQRRAKAVRDYYKSLGVNVARVATISYGKERPVCSQASEECYARNRRVETLVAFPAGLSQAR